ncbi:MAG: carbonic anhydrase [Sphingomonadales bacterium]|jgi:carbonic anhydrase
MAFPEHLYRGYERFLNGRFKYQQSYYQDLAIEGQSPKVMVIACCDSRVDPAAIFDAGPGELFIVRNVANLVPPHRLDGTHHGTSAAIEFAVCGLKVDHIVVLGHAQCGGVQNALESDLDHPAQDNFISRWMSIMAPAKSKLLENYKGKDKQRAMEEAVVRASLDNLMTFPMVKDAVEEGRLQLHGAHFGIADGKLAIL